MGGSSTAGKYGARSVLARWPAGLKRANLGPDGFGACEQLSDFYEFQWHVFDYLHQVEERRGQCSRMIKRLKRGEPPPRDAPPPPHSGDPSQRESWDLEAYRLPCPFLDPGQAEPAPERRSAGDCTRGTQSPRQCRSRPGQDEQPSCDGVLVLVLPVMNDSFRCGGVEGLGFLGASAVVRWGGRSSARTRFLRQQVRYCLPGPS